MQFSPQQLAIFQFIEDAAAGSATVEAVAGSGKTTTLVESLEYTTGTVAFLAYNTRICEEIKKRVPDDLKQRVKISTFHSAGFEILRSRWPRPTVDQRAKADRMVTELKIPEALAGPVKELVSLGKQYGAGILFEASDLRHWYDLVDHFSLADGLPSGMAEVLVDFARQGLDHAVKIAGEVIDFDDMIWLPLVAKLSGSKYDWVFIDEAQDTNPARRALARVLLAPGGRVIAVGDKKQSVYAFTGANSNAMDLIEQEFNTTALPLTVSYRCPKAVVNHARRWVDHITSAADAPEGLVDTMTIGPEFVASLEPDDVILSRLNAPNAALAFWLLRQGVACRIEGRDIGRGLLKLVNKWKIDAKSPAGVNTLLNRLFDWCKETSTRLIAKGKESEAARIQDQIDTLEVIAETCRSITELRNKVNAMFTDDDGKSARTVLTLSSIHRAKGREWDHVYWLDGQNPTVPKWARQQWEISQEDNLCYVATTRAKKHLTLLPPFKREDAEQ